VDPNPEGVTFLISMSDVIEFLEVDKIFLCRWFMCPIAVAGVIFKCLLIACSVKPSQVVRWLLLTACRSVDIVGLNIALCN
jgi:hypothetical protein